MIKEYKINDILNAVNIDQNNVEGGLPKNKGPVLFVCDGGALSKKTSLSLRSKKLDNVFYIKGGQLEWEISLLPCETKAKE